jgi:Zn-dependent protease
MGGPIFDLFNYLTTGNWIGVIAELGVLAILLLICFPVHEFAHAWAAYKLGDNTSNRMGRLTLNPVKHLDPLGSLLFVLTGFGWAKPVPVNPYYLNGNPKTSFALVAIAGPVSNIILAIIFAVVYQTIDYVGGLDVVGRIISIFCFLAVRINLSLAFFNLIPIPPLDGSRILSALLPNSASDILAQIERYSFLILMLLVYTGVLNGFVSAPVAFLSRLLLG